MKPIERADEMLKDLFFMAIVITILTIAGFAFASDIEQAEVRPDVSVWKLDTVRFLVFTKTAEITYRKGYIDGEFIGTGGEKTITFMDVADNPETPQDETSTEFTQLIQAINAGNNIKNTITNVVKVKLGL